MNNNGLRRLFHELTEFNSWKPGFVYKTNPTLTPTQIDIDHGYARVANAAINKMVKG